MLYELKEAPYTFAHKGFKIEGEFKNSQLLMRADDFIDLNIDKMSKEDIRDCLTDGEDFEWIFTKENIKNSIHDLEIGDEYYLVESSCGIKLQRYFNNVWDRGYIKTAHAYLTEREAVVKLQREIIEAELLALGGRVEFIKDEKNWLITCDSNDISNVTVGYISYTPHHDVFFNSYEEAEEAIRTVGKERILKYWLRVVDAK